MDVANTKTHTYDIPTNTKNTKDAKKAKSDTKHVEMQYLIQLYKHSDTNITDRSWTVS